MAHASVRYPLRPVLRTISADSPHNVRRTQDLPVEVRFPWRCDACGARDDAWTSRCLHCGTRNAVMRRTEPDVQIDDVPTSEVPTRNPAEGIAVEPGTAERVVYERISTGFPSLDEALSGGFARTTLMLMGGDRGCGKTTLTLDCFQRSRLHAAYGTAEQTASQVVAIAQRIGATRRGLFIFETKDLDDALDRFDKLGARLTCLDSLNRFRVAGVRAERGSPTMCAAVIERCQSWARERNAAVMLISHFTKEGDFAGRSDVQHDVDAMLRVRKYRGRVRLVTVEKTRLGEDECRRARFIMDARGAFVESPLVAAAKPVHDTSHGTAGDDGRGTVDDRPANVGGRKAGGARSNRGRGSKRSVRP